MNRLLSSVTRATAVLLLVAASACSSPSPLAQPSHGAHGAAATTSIDFDTQIRPILAARAVLSPTATTTPADPAGYGHHAIMHGGPSGFVVPFDAERSLMVRFVEDLPASAVIPFPNLRNLSAAEWDLVKRWIEAGAPHGDHSPFTQTANLLFACNQGDNTVSIFDAESLRLIRIVDFADYGIPSAPYGPHHITFEPDGSAWYVSLVSAGVVAKMSMDLSIDPSDPAFMLGRTRAGVFATPGMLALDAETKRLFVGRSTLSDPLASGFAVIDRETMDVDVIATPFNVPHAMTVTPDGRFALTAELTGTQQESRIAVYDTATGDLALVPLPATTGAREFIHFSILGAHHMMGMSSPSSGGMDHGGMDHSGMNHGAASSGYPYTATLTSRSTDEVLFFSLAQDGTLTFTGSAPGGDGPYHAHASHDGASLLIPDQRGSTVTIMDAETRAIARSVEATAPAGPLSQPHSPAPSMDGTRFFVTSSNLNGAWTPTYAFLGPPGPDGTRQPKPAGAFGNLAVFSMDGALQQVIQLGAYPSGLEPFSRSMEPMNHEGMEHGEGEGHGEMDHGGMDHDGH